MIVIGNSAGSFALFTVASRYRGVFFWEKEMMRTIARIGREGGWAQELWQAVRGKGNNKETCWFAHNIPVFFYESTKPQELLLDVKQNYDNRTWGRHYEFSMEGKTLVGKFRKENDWRETSEGEYEYWLAFHGCEFDILNEWVEEYYEFDASRKSFPDARFVFKALRAKGSFALSCSAKREDAIKLARSSWKRKAALFKQAKEKAKECGRKSSSKFGQAERHAKYSLRCMEADHGLFAGLPWFHQRWARDELISVKGLLIAGQNTLAKTIVLDWMRKLLPDGKLPGTLTHRVADSGWVFVRARDLLPMLSQKEKAEVRKAATKYLNNIAEYNTFLVADPKETWMDSLDRPGARVEIQALALAAARLLRDLNAPHPFEQSLKKAVKESFWTGKYLKDAPNDPLVRPNIFIAAYAYPDLLSKSEWEQCFDHVLPKLWCAWGGLATLSKRHDGFAPEHTGEDPTSYHKGDSWFWVNNLAAIVLHDLDEKKYNKYITKIVDASIKDILTLGAIGHASEVSSARKLAAEGSPVQAWSAATFLELAEKIKK